MWFTQVDYPTGCWVPALAPPETPSFRLKCVNATAATQELYATKDCSGAPASNATPFAFATTCGADDEFDFTNVTCVSGDINTTRYDAVMTSWDGPTACPAGGGPPTTPPMLVELLPVGVCVPKSSGASATVTTCDAKAGLTETLYPPGCPAGQDLENQSLPFGCADWNGFVTTVISCRGV